MVKIVLIKRRRRAQTTSTVPVWKKDRPLCVQWELFQGSEWHVHLVNKVVLIYCTCTVEGENVETSRFHVHLLDMYRERLPENAKADQGPFYLRPLPTTPQEVSPWFIWAVCCQCPWEDDGAYWSSLLWVWENNTATPPCSICRSRILNSILNSPLTTTVKLSAISSNLIFNWNWYKL